MCTSRHFTEVAVNSQNNNTKKKVGREVEEERGKKD